MPVTATKVGVDVNVVNDADITAEFPPAFDATI
jgi:hypothetical protein